MRSWNGPSWSISVEMFFYTCFPFLVRWVVVPIRRRGWTGRAIVAIAAAAVIGFLVVSWLAGLLLLGQGRDPETARLLVFRLANVPALRLGEFLCGCLLGAAYLSTLDRAGGGEDENGDGPRAADHGLGFALLASARNRTLLLGGAAATALAVQWTPPCLGDPCGFGATDAASFVDLRSFAIYVPIAVVMVAAVAWGDSPVARFLRHPAMIRLGEISYAFYLLQWTAWLVINSRPDQRPSAVEAWLAIAATLAAAFAAHRWIEQPGRRWVRGRDRRARS